MILPLMLLAGANVGAAPAQSAPSYDCRRATGRVETVICADADLARDDTRLAYLYTKLLRHALPADLDAIRRDQRGWLTKRDACGAKTCIVAAYDDRETWLFGRLDTYNRLLRRPVARVGQCQVTTIEWIGPRLGDGDRPDAAGTSVSFANGVDQVSYDFERPVAASRPGDKARVCLVSIPRHCPPGDARGRQYAVTNLRTGGRWRMPDAEHQCGGA